MDGSSLINVMFKNIFEALKLLTSSLFSLTLCALPIYNFRGMTVLLGTTQLLTIFSQDPLIVKIRVNFVVIDFPSAYNMLIGWPTLVESDVVVSYDDLIMKFSV